MAKTRKKNNIENIYSGNVEVGILINQSYTIKHQRNNYGQPEIKPSLYNLCQILRYEPRLKDCFKYDEMHQRIYVDADNLGSKNTAPAEDWLPLVDLHVHKIREICCDIWDVEFGKNTAFEAVQIVANENPRNLLLDYLQKELPQIDDEWIQENRNKKLCTRHCQKDCKGHTPLEMWCTTYLRCEDTPITRVYSKKWLIGVVARLHATEKNPVKFDTSFVWLGEQGKGKSTCAERLAFYSRFKRTYFGDTEFSMANRKEAVQLLLGKAIYEIKELAKRTNDAQEKAFLDTQIHDCRIPWARKPQRFVVKNGFIFSTNPVANLYRDATGCRRFWTIEVGQLLGEREKLPVDAFTDAVPMLWAEAFYWYKQGTPWWLNAAEERLQDDSNSDHIAHHPLTDAVLQAVAEIQQANQIKGQSNLPLKIPDIIKQIWQQADPTNMQHLKESNRKNQAIITDILLLAGYRKKRVNNIRGWFKK